MLGAIRARSVRGQSRPCAGATGHVRCFHGTLLTASRGGIFYPAVVLP